MKRIRRSDVARQERLDRHLYKAVERGNITDVKSKLASGARLMMIGESGNPLHLACRKGHLSITLLLLEAGAPTNLLGESHYAPLHLACRYGHSAIVSALINYNANVDIQSKFEKRTPLHIVAQRDSMESCEILIAKGAKVNIKDLYGNTPLHMAARTGNIDIVEFLLENGAKTDIYDNDGWTALHFAASEGYTDVINLLISKHSLIDQQNKFGRSPLHWACSNENIPAVETLLSCGASPLIKDGQGKVPGDATHNSVIKRIIKLYEENFRDGEVAATSTLDMQMTLQPIIRNFSRYSRMDSRRSSTENNIDEIDGAPSKSIETPTDISNSLACQFGPDMVPLIDKCFGQDVDLAFDERLQSCLKYKQFLMTVASLLYVSSGQINTLYSTVSASLQNQSQIPAVDILKVVFETLQSIDDNMNDFRTEICAAAKATSLGMKSIIDSSVEYTDQIKAQTAVDTLKNKASHFHEAHCLDEIALLIAKEKNLWRKLLPILCSQLSSKNLQELEQRIEMDSDKEFDRASSMLFFWHVPKESDNSNKSIKRDELSKALEEVKADNDIQDGINDAIDTFQNEGLLINLVNVGPKTSQNSEEICPLKNLFPFEDYDVISNADTSETDA